MKTMSNEQKRLLRHRTKGVATRDKKETRAATGAGVYVLRECGTNMFKIGCTTKFEARYPSLRRPDNPRPLKFVGWLSRDPCTESEFHLKFSEFASRLGGGAEWFDIPESEVADLEAHLLP